jgi:nucleotide-binding universal stress UspA family protein
MSRTELVLFRAGREPVTPGVSVRRPSPTGGLSYDAYVEPPEEAPAGGTWDSQTWEAARSEIRDGLEPVAATLRRDGWTVRVAAALGLPAAAIREAAGTERADVIAMTTHGRKGVARLVLGSVAEAVVRDAPVPVLLIRPQAASEGETEEVPEASTGPVEPQQGAAEARPDAGLLGLMSG